MAQHERLPSGRRKSSVRVGGRVDDGELQAPLEALRSLQRTIGNAAVQRLLETSAEVELPARTAAPEPIAQREVDLEGSKTEEDQPTVRLFDAVGLEIYVLGPLRRAEAKVQEQEWEAAEPAFPIVGQALIEFFDHYQKTRPALAEQLITSKNFLGTIYTHVRHRQGKRDASDQKITELLTTAIKEMEGEHLPDRRPSAATDLIRPGDEEPGQTGTVRLFDGVGYEIYVLGPLRRALGRVEEQEWEAAEGHFTAVGHALIEFYDNYRVSDPVLAERLLGYKNFLGIIYTNIKYRGSDLGASDEALIKMMDTTIVDLEALGKTM